MKEDVWINTMCRRCQSECGIRVHRVDGVAVKIEGITGSSVGSQGGVCAKGLSGLQVLYDPNRLKWPLRRTNPEKGIGVDPRWKRISWDEALGEIAERLQKAVDISPARVMVEFGIINGMQQPSLFLGPMMAGLSSPQGSPIPVNAAGATCGNAGHFLNALNYASFVIVPDYKYCDYLLVFGTNHSFGGFQQYANRLAAEAHRRGMKVVAFDPACNGAGSKADEWVPIVPGTDGMVALALLHVIVNELGICDKDYLKHKTNAPYLIGPDGHYVRNKETNRPMVWDSVANAPKDFNSEIGDFALDGDYSVDGVPSVPVWTKLVEHLQQYTPEAAEKVCGVPAATLRRIATEYANAAQIGSTIEIEGHQLPLRPVATLNIRSAGTHANGAQALFAIDLLHHVVGAAGAPGGCTTISNECHGYPTTGKPYVGVKSCPDGFVTVGGKWLFPESVWPLRKPKRPQHSLEEMFPCALEVPILRLADRDEIWEKSGLRPQVDVLVNYSTNPMMNASNPAMRASFYKGIPFIVDFDIFSNEFNEAFADILLPDTSYLEKADWEGTEVFFHGIAPGMDNPWTMHVAQPVIEPQYERRYTPQVLIELFKRMGRSARMAGYFNHMLGLEGDKALKPDEDIVWEDLCDRAVTNYFGEEHSWEWFKENGYISWPKKLEEVYWKQFKDARVQIYWEWMLDLKTDTMEIAQEIGLEKKLRWENFSPLPVWNTIRPMECTDSSFDLYAFTWAETFQSNTNTQEQPWVDEMSKLNPYTYYVNMNAGTAAKKGLKAGDRIELEEAFGRQKLQGVLQTREGLHPECIHMIAVAGHWAKGLPVAKGKGPFFNSLNTVNFGDCDPICLNTESVLRVRVRKVKPGRA